MSSEQTYHFEITMSCTGCSGAIDRTLKKLEGVKSYNVSLENQCADIVAEPYLHYDIVLEKLRKTGKTINSATVNGETRSVCVQTATA